MEKKSSEKVEDLDEEEYKIKDEYRDQGKISTQTLVLYIKASGYKCFIIMIIFNFVMQASRSFIDFWLKSEISDEPNQIFVALNGWFNN